MITPNYLELTVGDLDEARSFYRTALGFDFTDYGDDYTAVEGGPVEIGFSPSDSGAPVSPLPVFEADDLDAALADVRAAGGRVVRDPFDYPGGRRFHFLDPSGNEVAIYQRA